MKLDGWLHQVAGTIVVASVALGTFVSPWWLVVTASVGLSRLQSAFSGWCPMTTLPRFAGEKEA